MALNPVAFTEKVVHGFLRYQLTAYHFADERLHEQMRRLLSLDETRQSSLLQGPYVSLSLPFRQGAAVGNLLAKGLSHPHMWLRIPTSITHLYGRQEEAVRAISEGRTTLISTRYGVRQGRVFPLPHRESLPLAAGRRRCCRHQRRHRLPHERAGGGPVRSVARAARGDGYPLRDGTWGRRWIASPTSWASGFRRAPRVQTTKRSSPRSGRRTEARRSIPLRRSARVRSCARRGVSPGSCSRIPGYSSSS